MFGHAVVIGSSFAGLTAARVLSDYFNQVTIIDRDGSLDPIEFRRGAPQTRHAHRLPPRGQMILEQQFPGLVDELRYHDGRGYRQPGPRPKSDTAAPG